MPRLKYNHACPEWGYMKIDERSIEFECCSCYQTGEIQKVITFLRKKAAIELRKFRHDKKLDHVIPFNGEPAARGYSYYKQCIGFMESSLKG
jgi:hypothetical protein